MFPGLSAWTAAGWLALVKKSGLLGLDGRCVLLGWGVGVPSEVLIVWIQLGHHHLGVSSFEGILVFSFLGGWFQGKAQGKTTTLSLGVS